ncbi:MAG: DUF2748 family protein [Rickettsiales bacterium]|nr:DUF2748 family protein [Rickettsiales bacterium]
MIENEYHVLHTMPAYLSAGMPPELERLARQLVATGLLRINADHERNFVHYSSAGFDRSFSYRQLTDSSLTQTTRQIIADTLPGMAGEEGIKEVFERLIRECKKGGMMAPEREFQIARLLVQATHPSVIRLIMAGGVNIYVSYSHNISDLMGVHFWENEGLSQGMQAIGGDGAAVYVSCGGNPFILTEEQKKYQTDGFPALARLMVIAAQELGHFADLKRNAAGQCVARHSAHFMPFTATHSVKSARRTDIEHVHSLQSTIEGLQPNTLLKLEKDARFYRKHRKWKAWRLKKAMAIERGLLKQRARAAACSFVELFPENLHPESDFATNIAHCLEDMQANLTPRADAYRHHNPEIEEAIACVEALARVPQQVIKWGHAATQYAWPNLYPIYYQQVIPANIEAIERMVGQPIDFSLSEAPSPEAVAYADNRPNWQKYLEKLQFFDS